MYEVFPGMMKHLPGPQNAIFSHCNAMEAVIREEVEKHRRDLDPSTPRDCIDTFLIEMGNPNIHRAKMPFTDAVVHEIQRMGNIVPLNAPRMAHKDTTLVGYLIPKTEWVTPSTHTTSWMLRDTLEGPKEGKCVCLGEGLVSIELFLFFVSLFQKFSFSSLDGVELSLEGATRTPHPFKIHTRP
ncbi:unnamed protein product [Coregonus sp. 'balchen']|nr:unnamed protein product [Coregonus sp. 'balchen']